MSYVIFLLTMLSVSVSFAIDMRFESDARVKKSTEDTFSQLKAGDKLSLSRGDSLLVVTPKSLPILVVSPENSATEIVMSDADIQSVLNESMAQSINGITNEIIDGLRKAEALLKKRDYVQAQAIITPLKSKYPAVSSVLFMSGSIFFLLNNKSAALVDIEKGLEIDPKDVAALQFHKKLKGIK